MVNFTELLLSAVPKFHKLSIADIRRVNPRVSNSLIRDLNTICTKTSGTACYYNPTTKTVWWTGDLDHRSPKFIRDSFIHLQDVDTVIVDESEPKDAGYFLLKSQEGEGSSETGESPPTTEQSVVPPVPNPPPTAKQLPAETKPGYYPPQPVPVGFQTVLAPHWLNLHRRKRKNRSRKDNQISLPQ